MRARLFVVPVVTMLVAACAYIPRSAPPPSRSAPPPVPQPTPQPFPQPVPVPPPDPQPIPQPVPRRVPDPQATPTRPSRPGPIADLAINLQGQCTQVEADGYRENATLRVRDSRVEALSWELHVGRKGSCRFQRADFEQTRSRPHIELLARDGGGCKLMVWRDNRRITLAHADCTRRCTPGIYDSAWPVMFDPVTGGCARP